jgi:hypothetical protein
MDEVAAPPAMIASTIRRSSFRGMRGRERMRRRMEAR